MWNPVRLYEQMQEDYGDIGNSFPMNFRTYTLCTWDTRQHDGDGYAGKLRAMIPHSFGRRVTSNGRTGDAAITSRKWDTNRAWKPARDAKNSIGEQWQMRDRTFFRFYGDEGAREYGSIRD